jgi:carbon monoxide dehydrogenase subunit G
MELSGETLIPAPIDTVWAGLNNPDILRRCIPGCESLEQISPTEMAARVVQKIGPVSASFAGKVTLSDLDPPHSYRISGQGSGGVAGFAKGSALVSLAKEDAGTRLSYSVDVAVGGKIAQLGSRMITGLSNRLAAEFFQSFSDAVAGKVSPLPAQAVSRSTLTSKPVVSPVRAVLAVDGPGWRLFALAGWTTAAVLAAIAILQVS